MIERIAISGTRSTDHRPERHYDRLFGAFLGPFARGPEVHVYIGGAPGIDTLALRWLASETAAAITVVVPGRLDEQPSSAAEEVRAAVARQRLHELVELRAARFPSVEAYHARNRWMVERCQLLVAFPLTGRNSGGTAYTISLAAGKHLPRLVVPV